MPLVGSALLLQKSGCIIHCIILSQSQSDMEDGRIPHELILFILWCNINNNSDINDWFSTQETISVLFGQSYPEKERFRADCWFR